MDEVIANIVAATSIAEIVKDVIPALKKIDKTSTLKANKDNAHPLSAILSDGQDPLDVLSPDLHAVGYLYVLNARCVTALQSGAELGPGGEGGGSQAPEQGSSAAAVTTPTNPLYNFIHAFVQLYDPEQIRLVPDQVTIFAKLLTRVAEAPKSEDAQADAPPQPPPSSSSSPSLPLLSALETFLFRYSPPGILTAVHPIFLQGVLESRNGSNAGGREVTRRWFGLNSGSTAANGKGENHAFGGEEGWTRGEITDVDTSNFPIKYQDHLLYHYYGGVLLSLEKEYRRAIDFFEICISSPGSGISLIQLDAYKKLILVQLLSSSSSSSASSSSSSSTKASLPPYTHNAVVSACKGLKGYNEFVDAYKEEVRRGAAGLNNGGGGRNGSRSGTIGQGRKRLDEVVKSQKESFERDLNFGLVLLTLKAFRRRQIQRLTKTYLTLSIKEIAGMVDWSEEDDGEGAANAKEPERWKVIESEVKSMIHDGEIHGSIGSQEADLGAVIVTFTDDPELYTSHETVERVTRAIEEARKLELDVAERERRLERNFDWVGKAYNSASSNGTQGVGGGFGTGVGLGSLDDVMGDDDWAE